MRLLREPLLQFAVLAAALIGLYFLAMDRGAGSADLTIEIGEGEIAILADAFQRQWRRPPIEEELRGLVRSRLREEVLYREALAVGLDRDDVVVRRRMVQKMELLSQDVALLADPTEPELRSFFEEHRDEYTVPPRISFSHVFFNEDRRGDAAEETARRLLAELRTAPAPPESAEERGDRFLLEYDFSLVTPMEVDRLFGEGFGEELFALQPGWQGPLRSGYGLHLVHIGQRVEGRARDLGEIRDRVVIDFNRQRTERAREALFEKLSARYRITIDEAALRNAATPQP